MGRQGVVGTGGVVCSCYVLLLLLRRTAALFVRVFVPTQATVGVSVSGATWTLGYGCNEWLRCV